MTSSISVGVFSPSTINNCVLWFDAADSNTFTLSGTAISNWRDKSSNAYSVGQANSSFQPVFTTAAQNGLSGVQLATDRYLFNNGSNMPNFTTGSATSVFITGRNASANTGWNITNTVWFTGAAGGTGRYHFSLNQGATAGTTLYANSAFVGQVTSNPVGVSSNAIFGFTASATSATIHTNGSSDSYAGVSLPNANDATYFIFGDARNSSGVASNIMIFEMVGFNRQVTTFERQQIEGYFAWKWGITSVLPATHPYKNNPFITIRETVPRFIPNTAYIVPISTYSTIKTLTLPVVSTNAGRMLILKDYLGYAGSNNIFLSTQGLDRIERSNISSLVLSNAFGAWTFMNDGITNWFLMDAYRNSLSFVQPAPPYSNFLWTQFRNMTSSTPSFTAGGSGWGNAIGTAGAYNPVNYQDGDSRAGQSDQVGVVCKGYFYSSSNTTVNFRIIVDDGGYVWFNNTGVITNAWILQGDTTYTSATLNVTAGYTPFQFNFYEWGGGMTCELYYSIAGGAYQSDGTGRFFHDPSSKTYP